MKRLWRRLGMYLRADCYCYNVPGDNRDCPAHSMIGRAVRFVAGIVIAAILLALLIAYSQMPSL